MEDETRIPPVDVETLPEDLRKALEEQRAQYGEALYPYLFYARNPALPRHAKAMWAALNKRRSVPAHCTRAAESARRFMERVRVLTRRQCCREQQKRISTEKIKALFDYAKSPLFSDAEKVVLEYADAMTDTSREVDDELFARLQRHYDDDTIAELTMLIAWENSSSRFNSRVSHPVARVLEALRIQPAV